MTSVALGLLLCVLPLQAREGEEARPLFLTMDEAVRMALERNPSVMRTASAVQEAMAALAKARAAQRLTVATDASVVGQGPATELFFPMPTGGVRQIELVPKLSWQLDVTAVQPLYHGGSLYYQEKLARLGLDVARIEQQRQKQQIARDVRRLFLSVLQAEQLEEVARENVSRAARHLQDARARVEAGVAPGFDVIRAEAEVANANHGLVAARAAVDATLAALKTVLSITVTTAVELQRPELTERTAPEEDPSAAIDMAISQRPEVKAADMAVQLAEAQIGLARATSKPTVDLFASYRKMSTKGFGGHDWGWTIGLQATKLLSDGGLTRSAVREAEAKREQAKQTARQLREAVALETYQALVKLREAREKIAAAEKAVAQAEEAMRIADLRYREGVAPAVEVTDARAALIAARANLVNARFGYEQALVDLDYALGVPVSKLMSAGSAGPTRSSGPAAEPSQGKTRGRQDNSAKAPASPQQETAKSGSRAGEGTSSDDDERAAVEASSPARYVTARVPAR